MSRLALGTAQLGLPYGATNRHGRPSDDVAMAIFVRARAAGIADLDTAAAYGDAEAVIGRSTDRHGFRIVTKIARGSDDAGAIAGSLARLAVPRVHGLLAHRVADLLDADGDRFMAALRRGVDAGLVDRVGVSVYSPEELRAILVRHRVDLVQLPLSAVDRRFVDSGLVAELAARGVEVHARSVFLQGTLLAEPASLTGALAHLAPTIARFRTLCAEAGTTPLAAALGVALSEPGIAATVVGVTSVAELDEIVAAAGAPRVAIDLPALGTAPEAVVDPRLWRAA